MAFFFKNAFDSLKDIGGAIMNLDSAVLHNEQLDSQIEYIKTLRQTLEKLCQAIEAYITGETRYVGDLNLRDLRISSQTNKENHPKRKLSSEFIKASNELGKTPLAQGFNSFGLMLACYAASNENYLVEFYHDLLKPIRAYCETDLEIFFTKLESLNKLKADVDDSSDSRPSTKKKYDKKLAKFTILTNETLKKENDVILSALIKVFQNSRNYFEDCYNMSKKVLVMCENIKAKNAFSKVSKNLSLSNLPASKRKSSAVLIDIDETPTERINVNADALYEDPTLSFDSDLDDQIFEVKSRGQSMAKNSINSVNREHKF